MNSILQRLIEMDDKNRLHHGFLFVSSGESSVSLMQSTVSDFILHLFTKDFSADQKMMIEKKIGNQNHPDLFKLQATEGEIKIESIREMQRWLSIPPLETSKKIVIIDQAHHLNNACSNALLKTLEEPPSYALLILTTNSVSRILPTIRSRLFCIQFADAEKIDSEEKKEWADNLQSLLLKKTYSDKEIFMFTEQFSDQRDDLVYLFNLIHQTIRDRMLAAELSEFNKLEKMFDLALQMEGELYQNYGNISLGLDRFFIEWRNA